MMDLNYRRRQRLSDHKASLKIGSKYSAQLHDLDGLPSASEQEALQSTTSLFEVITDSSLILGPEHEKKNLSDQSGTDDNKKKEVNPFSQEAHVLVGGDLFDTSSASLEGFHEEYRDESALLRKKVEGLQSGQCIGGICKDGKVQSEDFVFAIATHQPNEPTLIAGRSGRLGFRTYVATNYTETEEIKYPAIDSETWAYYPDDVRLRSFYEGDTRAALVPFLAYRDLGPSFKWLFYGDDDTILFLDPAKDLVKDLDPETPYFLTDHLWYSNWNYGYQWHPHWRAPRCLLCNSDIDISGLRMKMVKACPCTPKKMCELEDGYDNVLDKRKCSVPRSPTLTYSMHGGAGALISIGLLKQVSLEFMEDCVLSEWSTGGDALITICLWKAGYAMTDPGPLWHEDGLTHFDPSPRKLMLDQTSVVIPRAAYMLGNFFAKAAGSCDDLCQSELKNVVSLHLRSRLLTNSSEGAGIFLRGVTRYYSQLQGHFQSDGSDLSLQLHDLHDVRAAWLANDIDRQFKEASTTLIKLIPNFKIIAAAKTRWPVDGGASVFVPRSRLIGEENGTVVLGYEDILKGGSAGVARDLLESMLEQTLRVYPPRNRYRLLP